MLSGVSPRAADINCIQSLVVQIQPVYFLDLVETSSPCTTPELSLQVL